jgi:cysteine desulfurase family protein
MGKIVYFDNAATTFPKPDVVYTFMDSFYREYGVNVGRGQHKLASVASNLVEETRLLLMNLFHCTNKKIVFTNTATEAINIILQGLKLRNNSNIYISPFEHNAVIRVLHYLQGIYNLNLITLPVDKITLDYDLEKIRYQFTEKNPDMLVLNHASNVCGIVSPINSICTLSKEYDCINIVDMAQTAGLIDTDLSSNVIDFTVFAGHKALYGPFGIAGFTCRGDIELKPLLYGGTGFDSANKNQPETIPERFEVGSPNIMAISGLHAALNWINETSIQRIYQKDISNHKKLLDILKGFKNIKIVGHSENNSVGIVSCVFDGYSSDNIGHVLSEHGIAVRAGLHCAPSAHKFLGTYPAGTVRFSVNYFNNDNDFSKLYDILEYIEINS